MDEYSKYSRFSVNLGTEGDRIVELTYTSIAKPGWPEKIGQGRVVSRVDSKSLVLDVWLIGRIAEKPAVPQAPLPLPLHLPHPTKTPKPPLDS
jgi:hypothetical protein